MSCASHNRDGWTGFYASPLNITTDGVSGAHALIADYGLDRSDLWGRRNPDEVAPSWCALRGVEPANWGARAYVLRSSATCFAPARQAPFWSTPAAPHRLAHDFAQWRLMGKTISFSVDLHRVGCGAVLTTYLAALPAVTDTFEYYPQQPKDVAAGNPGCAGQEYYADANPELTGCESYGFEFDLFEGNVHSMHSTAHGCVVGLDVPGSTERSGFAPAGSAGAAGWFGRVNRASYPDPNVPSMHNRICDGDGTGVGVSGTGILPLSRSNPQAYGWGEAFTINTQRPFDVAIRFDDGADGSSSSWSYTTTLSQGPGRRVTRTTRKADSTSEAPIFPRAGTYAVRFAATQQQGGAHAAAGYGEVAWVVVDQVYVRAAHDAQLPVHSVLGASLRSLICVRCRSTFRCAAWPSRGSSRRPASAAGRARARAAPLR